MSDSLQEQIKASTKLKIELIRSAMRIVELSLEYDIPEDIKTGGVFPVLVQQAIKFLGEELSYNVEDAPKVAL